MIDHKEILKETQMFYQNLYNSQENDFVNFDLERLLNEGDIDIPTLDKTMSDTLENPLTYEELLKSLKSMKNNKSPGSDGFSAEF